MNLPQEIKLPSGAVLKLNLADFESSTNLLEVVAGDLRAVGVNINLNPAKLMESLAEVEFPVDLLKNVVCQAVTSKALKAAMWQCAGRCLYGGVAMVPASFEPVEARADYVVAAWEVIKFNLAPFFAGLPSLSAILAGGRSSSPK